MPRVNVKLTREQRIPADFIQIERADDLGVLVMASVDRLDVMAFSGRAQKPDFYLRFRSVERAEAYTADWLARVRKSAADRAAARAVRNAPHSLKDGDVLSAVWGYEQTNVDYYQVTAVVSPRMVELRKIAAETVEVDGSMTGSSVPLVGTFIEEPFRVRPDSRNTVKLASFMRASPLEFEEVAGVRVYRASRFSSYA